MRYLIDTTKPSKRAHVWNGNDTACRMWSTGGIPQKPGHVIANQPGGRLLCHMCSTAAASALQREPQRDAGERQISPHVELAAKRFAHQTASLF